MIRTSLHAFTKVLAVPSIKNRPEINATQISRELMSGLTVALALVPEAIAFAFVAGVHPLVGLYAAFIVGLITAIFGGRPGMISGATGALAVVMVSLVAQHGVQYLFATVILMGIIQIAAGIFRLGKFIRMVPHPVMLGFVNGLAIVIFLSQLSQFTTTSPEGVKTWIQGSELMWMLALVGVTMAIIWAMPKLTNVVPAPLVAILTVALLVIFFDLPASRVGDLASIEGGLPIFSIPMVPFDLETLRIILPYALILAAIGLIESLLTLNLVGDITGQKGGASKECMAQGGANVVTGFFGGMGGCAMIGQSMINIKSGGRMRLSGIFAALCLLGFILFGSSLVEEIPLAALVGVMFMVVVGTFAWSSIRLITRVPIADVIVILVVTAVTVWQDLAIAVIVGVILSALVYAWNAASRIQAVSRLSNTEAGAKVYEVEGPLFFGSATSFTALFDPKNDTENHVILDFKSSRVVDQSALKAIEVVAEKYENSGKRIQLRHLSPDCHTLLRKAGQLIIDSEDDPHYSIAVDYDIRIGRIASGH